MSTPRDDDALSWGGDDDPTLDVGDKHDPGRGSDSASEVADPMAGRVATPAPVQPEPLQPAPEGVRSRASADSPGERHPESAADSAADEKDAGHAAPLGNVGLVGIGMVAATYLLFAIGWLIAGLRLGGLGLPIPSVTVIALTVGAALAPIAWFVAVLVLTRAWRTWQRFLLLILGIVLLVPWPFLSLGAFA